MIQVLVVGGTGMLGSMLVDVLSKNPDLRVRSTFNRRVLDTFPANVQQIKYTACHGFPHGLMATLRPKDWIVNAAGLDDDVSQWEDGAAGVRAAVEVNTFLPLELLDVSHGTGCSVLHATSDTVYSEHSELDEGVDDFTESCQHTAIDICGKTKSLGEVWGERLFKLRCSLLGPEPRPGCSLLERFLAHPNGATVDGHINHRWNGVTTLAFAKITEAIVLGKVTGLDRDQHLVPFDVVSHYVLLLELSRLFRRLDLEILPKDAARPLNRMLATENSEINDRLWRAAGYYGPPKICEMLEQLAKYSYFFKRPNGERG